MNPGGRTLMHVYRKSSLNYDCSGHPADILTNTVPHLILLQYMSELFHRHSYLCPKDMELTLRTDAQAQMHRPL
jgi:hypothetical protein